MVLGAPTSERRDLQVMHLCDVEDGCSYAVARGDARDTENAKQRSVSVPVHRAKRGPVVAIVAIVAVVAVAAVEIRAASRPDHDRPAGPDHLRAELPGG